MAGRFIGEEESGAREEGNNRRESLTIDKKLRCVGKEEIISVMREVLTGCSITCMHPCYGNSPFSLYISNTYNAKGSSLRL